MKSLIPAIAATLWLLIPASSSAAEWKDLCNGKDLTGWTVDPDYKHWSVKDGVLIGKEI